MNFLLWPLLFCVKLSRHFLDQVLDIIFGWLYRDTHRPLPPLKSPLLLDSVQTLTKKIQNGDVTSEQLVNLFVERIKDVNPILNCVVDNRFEDALAEAREVDAHLQSLTQEEKNALFKEKPYLGVPFTIKDCFTVKGLCWTAGLWYRRHEKGTEDAPVVAAMRSAGCILLGVTNVSELCMWMESNNKVFGRSNNPYHTGRTVGGSSGGEGCLVSAAGTAWGVGSDVGGSIRMPAFFNGIFGHKATSGLVDNGGALPKAYGLIDTYLVTGPLCRHACDLAPMLRVLATAGGRDPAGQLAELQLEAEVDLSKLKVYYLEDDGGCPLITAVHPELRRAQARLLDMLREECGAEVARADLPNFYYSLAIWTNSMYSEPRRSFSQELVQGEGDVNPYLELVRWCLGRSVHTLPALLTAIGERFVFPESSISKSYVRRGDVLRQELGALLGRDGVLVYPSHPTPAPFHNLPILRIFNFAYTAIFNVLGNPVTQVPLGLDSQGVPLGVQIVAGRNMDRLCLAVASAVEAKLGGWVPPSPLQTH